jgi:hypothetical protein
MDGVQHNRTKFSPFILFQTNLIQLVHACRDLAAIDAAERASKQS